MNFASFWDELLRFIGKYWYVFFIIAIFSGGFTVNTVDPNPSKGIGVIALFDINATEGGYTDEGIEMDSDINFVIYRNMIDLNFPLEETVFYRCKDNIYERCEVIGQDWISCTYEEPC